MRDKNTKSRIGMKILYIIFSIVASIALWVYVSYAEDLDKSITVSNIPIHYINEESLTAKNLIMTTVSNKTVTLKFTGKRDVLAKLTNTTVSAAVDLSDISSNTKGYYQLRYTVNYPTNVSSNSVTLSSASTDSITVIVDNLVSKSVPLEGGNDVKVADGYQAKQMEFSPDAITVTGPEATVSQVDHAWVFLRGDNISTTLEEKMQVTLMDDSDNTILPDGLTLSTGTVLVRLPIVMVKEVPLAVNFIYGNSAKAANVKYTISPEKISISGAPDILAKIDSITLGTINLTEFSASTTATYNIVLPTGVTSVSGETKASVTVLITGLATSKVTATDIAVSNAASGYTATLITQSLDVTLRGPSEDLAKVTADDLTVTADLSAIGTSTGTFSVTATVAVDGYTDVDAIGEYSVSVTIIKD